MKNIDDEILNSNNEDNEGLKSSYWSDNNRYNQSNNYNLKNTNNYTFKNQSNINTFQSNLSINKQMSPFHSINYDNQYNKFSPTIPQGEFLNLKPIQNKLNHRNYNDIHANTKFYYPDEYNYRNDECKDMQWIDRANNINLMYDSFKRDDDNNDFNNPNFMLNSSAGFSANNSAGFQMKGLNSFGN